MSVNASTSIDDEVRCATRRFSRIRPITRNISAALLAKTPRNRHLATNRNVPVVRIMNALVDVDVRHRYLLQRVYILCCRVIILVLHFFHLSNRSA